MESIAADRMSIQIGASVAILMAVLLCVVAIEPEPEEADEERAEDAHCHGPHARDFA